jgi:ABC-type antimicrobial peptide transport system permease subunit
MRRFEIGTRMAIGAKSRQLITMVIHDNAKPVIVGVGLSKVLLLALYAGFSEALVDYMSLSLIGVFVMTLVLIAAISFYACYVPLRQYINRPAIYSLRGRD